MKRFVLPILVVAAAYFAVQGGEYSSLDLLQQRSRERGLRQTIDSLERDLDSLRTLKKQLETDPVVQERVAREVYGLVRGDKEVVYRFIDSARSKP